MLKHYVFFTRNSLPQPRADLVQVANCANAAANLGYSTVLTYVTQNGYCLDHLLRPFRPRLPDLELKQFYNIQDQLQVAALPMPSLFIDSHNKWTHPSTLICKYYLPLYLRQSTQIVHSRDWNFVKAAVQLGIPAVYEHHHHDQKQFEPEIVQHPLFQIAVTVADSVRDGMIEQGMPPDKVIKLHNGFNQSFLTRHQSAAAAWRDRLIGVDYRALAVYSGGLHAFKGVNLMIEAAKALPQVLFAFAGGNATQVAAYRELALQHQVENVNFLGYLTHEDLASLLQAANLLVHPHLLSPEATFTSPLKFFDYMAAGTPIVATEIPPLIEFKSAGMVAGWCEPNQPVALATCIAQVLESHPYRPEGYGESVDYVQQFSWENRIARILSHVEARYRPMLA